MMEEGAAGDGGGEMAEVPCGAGVGGGGGDGGRLWGGGWKRKIAIAGAAISSAPVLLPPLLVLSAVGFAFSVPFGVFFAGYACTDKIMRSLLPLPGASRSSISPQTSPPLQVEEDEAEEEFAEEEFAEVWEVDEAGKGRTETGVAAPEQKGGVLVGEPTGVEEHPVAASSDEAAGVLEEQREEKRTSQEGVRVLVPVPVPEWGGNGREVFEEVERKEEEEEEELRGAVPSTKAEEGAASTVASETGGTGKDSGEAPTNIAPKDGGAEGGRRRQAQEEEEEGKAMVIPLVGEAGEKETQLLQGGEGAVLAVLGRVGREREGLAEGPAALEREVSIDEPSGSGPEYIAGVVAERAADAPENAEFCAAAVVVVSTPLDFDEALMLDEDEEKKIWDQIDAIRMIVGLGAPRHPSCVEELRALYFFVGVEPPITLRESSRLEDVKHKLRLLKSIIGVE